MEEEGFCVGCWCENLASLFHDDEKCKSLMVKDFEIVHCTDGTINFNKKAVASFASTIANDEGYEWGQISEEEERHDAAWDVMYRFLRMVMEETDHLADFSLN
jgi:hypothetical protein